MSGLGESCKRTFSSGIAKSTPASSVRPLPFPPPTLSSGITVAEPDSALCHIDSDSSASSAAGMGISLYSSDSEGAVLVVDAGSDDVMGEVTEDIETDVVLV